MVRHLLAIIALATCAACGRSTPTTPDPTNQLTPVPATAEWPSASPEAGGLDTSRLQDLVLRIRRGDYGRITSLLIVRNSDLVVEEYFNGWSAQQPHTMQSVTKSVTSLLVGLAIDSGRLSLNDAVIRFFPEYQPLANADDKKTAITVADLLTMRSGFDWDESFYPGSPLQRMNDCQCDWLRFVLDWRMRDVPGTRWEYVSGATILLGGVIGSATATRLDVFAQSALFGPLDVAGASWVRGLPDGLPHAGGGLNLRPRDMAKLGALVLDDGRWRGQQIVTPAWINLTRTPVTRATRQWSGHTFDYGYGWWFIDDQGLIVTASGARGQWIFVVPSRRLVVASTANNDDGRWTAPVDFLYSHVLPAVH